MNAVEALLKKAETEDGLTTDEETRCDELMTEIDAVDAQIEKAQAREELAKRIAEQKAEKAAPAKFNIKRDNKPDTLEARIGDFNLTKAIGDMADNGTLTGLERDVTDVGRDQVRGLPGVGSMGHLSFNIPTVKTRDLLADTATAGAENVGVDVHDIIPFLYGKRLLPQLGAQVWRNLSADYKIPINDASGSVAWEGEGDLGAEASPTFTSRTMTPKRIGAFTDISKQLIRQATNSPDVNAFVTNNLRTLIDNAVETAAFIGGGAGEPSGVVDTITVTTSNTSAPTRQNMLDLATAIAQNNAEMGNLAYVTNPYIKSVLRTVDVGSDTGFFVWDGRYMDRDYAVFGEGMVEGYRAATTTLIGAGGTAGTNLNYVLFGNWNHLAIGQFGGQEVVVNPYTKAKNALIEVIVNSWVDVAVLQDNSFAYNLHTL